ncbi:polysaccharide deacetylase family protein [Aliagarivorans taiwanensis]|uniref:polysaccharide deacetylase family protein n=1 Tax=Aliagarivorans taiwanensis TaxID=561966 RepID=UPI00041BB9CC|nr:polysaccharide deacetylase family protein [Aliagarivorans taiwanensis]
MNKLKNFLYLTLLILTACNSLSDSTSPTETPQGRIALTFDDVYVNNWHSVKTEIENRGATATFFVSRYGDENAPVNTRNDEFINMLHDFEQSGFEIGAHTLEHEHPNEYIATHGLNAWLSDEVIKATCSMIDDGFTIYSFAYPFSNSQTEEANAKLLEIFDVIRTYSGKNTSHYLGIHSENSQIALGSAIDEETLNINELKKVIDNISELGKTLVLSAHDIANENPTQLFIKPDTLFEIIDYAIISGIEFINIKEINNEKATPVKNSICM